MWYLFLVVGGPKTSNDLVLFLCGFLARNNSRAHCPFLVKWSAGKLTGCGEKRQSHDCPLKWLLPTSCIPYKQIWFSSSNNASTASFKKVSITTEAIKLTGFPNSNSEKNLYQGSFFKSISSGLISRLYRGWWQGNGRERRITLCRDYIGTGQ